MVPLKVRYTLVRCIVGLALASLSFPVTAAARTSCEALARVSLPNTTINFAHTIAPGAFHSRNGGDSQTKYSSLGSFCRVAATIRPSSNSDIHVEIWMPESEWNRKFEAVGNGGWAGSISYADMAVALGAGYATASTDTGHQRNSAAFALGHPEKLTDYSYRAVHEMTVLAKSIIAQFYGDPPMISYFNGCSLGGHQGLVEAERYPADYSGIVSGAPSLNWTHLNAARMYIYSFMHRSAGSYIPPAKYPLIHNAVLQSCDALDGVKDGVIEDPMQCHFNPEVLQCGAARRTRCLTAVQVQSAQAMYSPIKNPTTGEQIYPAATEPGAELGWGTIAGPNPLSYPCEAFRYLIYRDPNWNCQRFNWATDLDRVLATHTGLTDFDYSTLRPFFDHGGKLLMYHGWSDTIISPMGTVDYFESIEKQLGYQIVGKSIELYMVPGMQHCRGGVGTDIFDKIGSMEQWVATGTAPTEILASHRTGNVVDRTRPVCPFGKVAAYKGSGSTNDAADFVCSVPR